MSTSMHSLQNRRVQILAGSVFVWFIAFPEDLQTLFRPIAALGDSISIGPAIIIASGLICWTLWRLFSDTKREQMSDQQSMER